MGLDLAGFVARLAARLLPREVDSMSTPCHNHDHSSDAVRDAEAIVCLAWATELLHRRDFTALALDTARQECQAASDRLVVAQRCGDPRQISLAHAMLEDALGAHRTVEVTGDRVHRALETVLGSLVHTRRAYLIAAGTRQLPGGESRAAIAPARRVLRWVGRFLARRVPALER